MSDYDYENYIQKKRRNVWKKVRIIVIDKHLGKRKETSGEK